MSVRTSMNFIQWLMRKWFGGTGRGLARFNAWWTRSVIEDPGQAFFVMLLFGLMILLLALALGAGILHYFGVDLFAAFVIGSQVIWVGNYLRIIVIDQYDQFKEEQNRMFDEIKHSDRNYRRMR